MATVLDDMEADSTARRKLLKLAAYTVPIIVGTLIAGQAAAASCDPNGLCMPNVNCHPECFPH